jgi:hypothetical protein
VSSLICRRPLSGIAKSDSASICDESSHSYVFFLESRERIVMAMKWFSLLLLSSVVSLSVGCENLGQDEAGADQAAESAAEAAESAEEAAEHARDAADAADRVAPEPADPQERAAREAEESASEAARAAEEAAENASEAADESATNPSEGSDGFNP